MHKYFFYLTLFLVFINCETTKDDTTTIDLGRVFVSSETQSKIGIFDFSDINNKKIVEYEITSDSSAGIYFDSSRDIVYQVDRENNRLNAYSRLSTNGSGSAILPSAVGTSDFSNPRGLTSEGNIALVAQAGSSDNGEQNALFMYDIGANEITLRNQFDVEYQLWDIQLVGNSLYTARDESDTLVIFNNFLANSSGPISPDIKIRLEGVTKIRGMHYVLTNDLMIVTDIGDPTEGVNDGQVILIEDFKLKLSAALQQVRQTISSSDMIFIKGSNTFLQNPVDVIYHEFANRIIVAERSTNGGMFLSFEYPVQDTQTNEFNLAPFYSINYSGISSLFFND